jgi:hypothetical protein
LQIEPQLMDSWRAESFTFWYSFRCIQTITLQVYWVQAVVELGYGRDEGRNPEWALQSLPPPIYVSPHGNVIFQPEKHYHLQHGRALQSRQFRHSRTREVRSEENFSETLQTPSLGMSNKGVFHLDQCKNAIKIRIMQTSNISMTD